MMHSIPFKKSTWFNELFVDYTTQPEKFKKFTSFSPSLNGLKLAAANRIFDQDKRRILVQTLTEQYQNVSGFVGSKVEQNIQRLLDSHVFTVTTGQQIHPFLGAQMVFNKIEAAIGVAKELGESHELDVVPVFWMASEDHDFEEVKTIHFFGKEFVWESGEKGAVGRMGTSRLVEVIDEMMKTFERDAKVVEYLETFKNIYAKHDKYADATREVAFKLYGEQGLIAIDADHAALKGLFHEVLKNEIAGNYAYTALGKTTDQLKAEGYKTILNPMQENLFKLTEEDRVKISKEEEKGVVGQPEMVSPNVVLRPLYQESVLPNLAYFAGPSELCYWLQLKGVFDAHEVPYPVLLPRKFTLSMRKKDKMALEAYGLDYSFLFLDEMRIREFVLEAGSKSLINSIQEGEELLERISENASEIGAKVFKEAKTLNQLFSKHVNSMRNLLSEEPSIKDKINKLLRIKQQYYAIPEERKVFGIEAKANKGKADTGSLNYFSSNLNTNVLVVEK